MCCDVFANLFLSAHPVNKALVSFLDLDRTGKMRLEDVCTLLLRSQHISNIDEA
jgi:hypothetical protein